MLLSYSVTNAEVIKIAPIVFNKKQKDSLDNPNNILLNLKKAILKNRKANQPSKEEEAKEILKRLKESIPTQSNISSKKIKKVTHKRTIKKHLHTITKKKIVKKVIKKHYKKIKKKSKVKKVSYKSTKPIGFVKTLGIVGKSKVYEANDLTIDKREEIDNDGVVDISTATTDSFKELPFVKPIEVIEVSQPFEASEAKRYLNKR